MDTYQVDMFGGFVASRNGDQLKLPSESQRLVAFVCLHDGALDRTYLAGRLWGDTHEEQARANLRSSLWRLRQLAGDLILADRGAVALGANVDTDVRVLQRLSRSVLQGRTCDPSELDYRQFGHEFLPGWYEDWVILERERMRQLCLHCLEATADALSSTGMFGAAIQALLAAIALDPLRESPQRQLMAVHLAEGNHAEAVRQYDAFARTLAEEIGLEPSSAMRELLTASGIDVAAMAGGARTAVTHR